MPINNFHFGGGASETTLGPFVLVVMLLAVALILLLPRKYIIVPLMIGTFLCPAGQTLVIGGLHVFVTRILILAGFVRLIKSRSSTSPLLAGGFNSLDKVFLLWAIFRAVAFVLTYLQAGAVINQGGFLWDVIGGYFLLRFLLRDDEDINRVFKTFAMICTVLAVTMLYERIIGVNLYGIIAGVRIILETRNGSIRAQGPFEHALLAGTFAATLLPFFFWLWKSGRSKIFGLIGIVASSIVPFTTACSTPIMAYGAAAFAICFWPLRKQMRAVRWGIVFGLVALQLTMKANFWWAIQHLDLIGGSSGWHRAELIDVFFKHFFDWWIIGTKDNATWGHMTWDLCNQFVAEGEVGGLVTFVCFIAIICIAFAKLGTARKAVEGDKQREWYFWIFGAALFAHIVAYFGVSYFDQTRFSWFILLAAISCATAPVLAMAVAPEQPPKFSFPNSRFAYPAVPSTSSSLRSQPQINRQFKARVR